MKTKKIISSIILIGLFAGIRMVSADWLDGLDLASDYGLPYSPVENIIHSLLLWILAVFTFLCVISFVVTGIMFLMAGSNADMATKAKTGLGYSIIGVAIGLSGYVIIRFIDDLLWGDL